MDYKTGSMNAVHHIKVNDGLKRLHTQMLTSGYNGSYDKDYEAILSNAD